MFCLEKKGEKVFDRKYGEAEAFALAVRALNKGVEQSLHEGKAMGLTTL